MERALAIGWLACASAAHADVPDALVNLRGSTYALLVVQFAYGAGHYVQNALA